MIVVTPDEAQGRRRRARRRAGRYDLVIYDRFRPDAPPEANALYFGVLPPGPAYEKTKDGRAADDPRLGRLAPADAVHPRPVDGRRSLKAIVVEPPPGSTVLIESNRGPLAFVAPREGFSDTVVAFAADGRRQFNTDWVKKISFPLFLFNALRSLGNARESAGDEVHLPGQPVDPPRRDARRDGRRSPAPTGKAETLSRTPQGTFVFNEADATGIYHARWEPDGPAGRSPSTSSTPARATSPRAASSPRATPPDAGRRLQDQDRLQPRRRHPASPPGPQGLVEAARRRWPWASSW